MFVYFVLKSDPEACDLHVTDHDAQILMHISRAMSLSNEHCGMDVTSLVIPTLCGHAFVTQLSGQIGIQVILLDKYDQPSKQLRHIQGF